jgi:tetratricopeptide (TPR) repeat protein
MNSPDPASLSGAPASGDLAQVKQALRPAFDAPRLREAARLLEASSFGHAIGLLRTYLKTCPDDPLALHLMAEAASRQRRSEDAERLLMRCLDLDPEFAAARLSYAHTLLELSRPEAAMVEADALLAREPRHPLFRRVKAMALEAVGDYAGASPLWRQILEDYPEEPDCWLRYGHALRGIGSTGEAVAAYRKAIALDPSFGRAYWGLENLKTFRFSADDVAQMEAQLGRTDLPAPERPPLHFALGKAYADAKDYPASFAHYARGNALHRMTLQYDPNVLTSYVARCKAMFTIDFFAARAGSGSSSRDPIFIVGMTRSGSTLVEQILASHPAIEGTSELFALTAVSQHPGRELARHLGARYPEILGELAAGELAALGERYLESVRIYRVSARPRFTDKMGANFMHVGLIQLILPNAKIVDVRRHPLACCWSNFTQLFAKGQDYAYRLTDLGRLYRDYVELMAHFDQALPGRVHRLFYEKLVDDPDAEVRCLLDYLGLPFDEACLQFHRNRRAVSTASSEQVRRPIFNDRLEEWQNYESWMAPLKGALGTVLDAYPGVPDFN